MPRAGERKQTRHTIKIKNGQFFLLIGDHSNRVALCIYMLFTLILSPYRMIDILQAMQLEGSARNQLCLEITKRKV